MSKGCPEILSKMIGITYVARDKAEALFPITYGMNSFSLCNSPVNGDNVFMYGAAGNRTGKEMGNALPKLVKHENC